MTTTVNGDCETVLLDHKTARLAMSVAAIETAVKNIEPCAGGVTKKKLWKEDLSIEEARDRAAYDQGCDGSCGEDVVQPFGRYRHRQSGEARERVEPGTDEQ